MWSENKIASLETISKSKSPFTIKPVSHIKGKVILPADKSISHRAIIISSICQGITRIENFLDSQDTLATLRTLEALGARIKQRSKIDGARQIVVYGRGLLGLKQPRKSIYVSNSGTTLRLLLGVLAGYDFPCRIRAGISLSQRPMRRVAEPLRLMGARIKSKVRYLRNRIYEEYPPITIKGGKLKPITYILPLPSAQVKSAILLAGLYTKGTTEVIEPIATRDHTEKMLKLFKARIKIRGSKIQIKGLQPLVSPEVITIPSDVSSASFFMVGASILPGSNLILKGVNLNPRRIGFIRVLKRMGADIQVTNHKPPVKNFEPQGDILVKSSKLKATIIKREEIPSLIDELPILMVAAAYAKGKTKIQGAGELRVKETDRINSMLINLKNMGADINFITKLETIIIQGRRRLKGAELKSFGDHRTAMSLIIGALAATGKSQIDDVTCISKSFPTFLKILFKRLS